MGRHGAEQIFALQRQYAQTRRPYREYFILEDGDAKETILSMRFNADILVRHGIQFTFRNMRHSATQRLVNHYLMADGSKIQDQPDTRP